MKKILLLVALGFSILSCKQKKETSDPDVSLIRGEFILIDDAGVIKVDNVVYGVEINDMAKELAKQIKPLQREEYDMVPVVVNAVIKDNPSEGWEEVVEITEIVGVTAPTSELPTKIKSVDEPENETNDESGE